MPRFEPTDANDFLKELLTISEQQVHRMIKEHLVRSTSMSLTEIKEKAEALRKEGIGMSNYERIVNDVLVLIRELAERCEEKK